MNTTVTRRRPPAPAAGAIQDDPPEILVQTMDGAQVAEHAQLIHLSGGEGVVHILEDETLIGRDPDAHITLGAGDISRKHARVVRSGPDRFDIEDLGSRNGTKVNGLPVRERQRLTYGDNILLGSSTILLFTHYNPLSSHVVQAQKMDALGRLAGGLVHDFNNLLGVVLANIEHLRHLMRARQPGADEWQCAGDIETAARRAMELTRSLLTFARRGEIEHADVEIASLVEDVMLLLRHTLPANIATHTEVPADLVIRGNRSDLQQMLINLCINAGQAMPDGGVLSVRATAVTFSLEQAVFVGLPSGGRYAQITVEDNGVGMDANTLRRAFEPFFSTRQHGEGAGMGLATVYGIVQNHGGHVHAQSEPGRGSRFDAYLPLAERAAAGATAGSREEAARSDGGDGGVVLVVDDHEAVRSGTARMLERLGHRAILAKDGHEAVAQLTANRDRIRLVLLDVRLPGPDGAETFHHLREVDPTVPVVFISRYRPAEVQDIVAAGEARFIAKPFPPRAIAAAIEETVRGGTIAPG